MDLKYAVIALILVYSTSFLEAKRKKMELQPSYGAYCQRQDCSPVKNGSQVLSYCQKKGLTMDGRCCIRSNGTNNITLGIDLSDCNITNLEAKMFAAFSSVEILMLQDNPISHTKPKYFVGLTNLTELYLPLPNGTCPGGDLSWVNINIEDEVLICSDQEDTCLSHNLTCPTRSNCQTAGPGSAYCFCIKNYYGYKCMRTGHFPLLTYSLSATAAILTVSISLWLMHRLNRPKDSA